MGELTVKTPAHLDYFSIRVFNDSGYLSGISGERLIKIVASF
jgi:hypothetical protein